MGVGERTQGLIYAGPVFRHRARTTLLSPNEFLLLKKEKDEVIKIKVPSGLCIIQRESSKPCRLQTKSSLHIKITGVTIKNKTEYVTVKPAWDFAERRIKQTQSIQRQQQRNRKAPTSARCADINLSSVLRRLRQEDGHKFKASLGYTAMISQPVLHSENLS